MAWLWPHQQLAEPCRIGKGDDDDNCSRDDERELSQATDGALKGEILSLYGISLVCLIGLGFLAWLFGVTGNGNGRL